MGPYSRGFNTNPYYVTGNTPKTQALTNALRNFGGVPSDQPMSGSQMGAVLGAIPYSSFMGRNQIPDSESLPVSDFLRRQNRPNPYDEPMDQFAPRPDTPPAQAAPPPAQAAPPPAQAAPPPAQAAPPPAQAAPPPVFGSVPVGDTVWSDEPVPQPEAKPLELDRATQDLINAQVTKRLAAARRADSAAKEKRRKRQNMSR